MKISNLTEGKDAWGSKGKHHAFLTLKLGREAAWSFWKVRNIFKIWRVRVALRRALRFQDFKIFFSTSPTMTKVYISWFLQFNLIYFHCWTTVIKDKEGSKIFHTHVFEFKKTRLKANLNKVKQFSVFRCITKYSYFLVTWRINQLFVRNSKT